MKTEKFQNKYRIPTARAEWHDYNGGEYFITICTSQRLHYFGRIINAEMVKNILGQKLDELILDVQSHNPYAQIPVYQIMPNHVHLIVCINGGDGRDAACHVSKGVTGDDCRDAACHVSTGKTNDGDRDAACHVSTGKNEIMQNIADQCGLLSTTIGGLKSALTKFANLNKLTFRWQTRFHDRIIRNAEEMNQIAIYIENNPLTWENDQFYTKE